jgi:hypothetical protein
MLTITRRVEIFKDGLWQAIAFKNLKPGMIFKLYDGDRIVHDEFGYTELRCASIPFEYTNEFGDHTLAVKTETYENVRSA